MAEVIPDINARSTGDTPHCQIYSEHQLNRIEPLQQLSQQRRFAIKVVAKVLPFRVNQYLIDELIDWDNIPDDPMFQMTFPQPGMLSEDQFNLIANMILSGAGNERIRQAARRIQAQLNPHPGGQQELNVPRLNGEPLSGIQHKYRETVLFFPRQGQTCHTYCTFCFRWPQFVGVENLQFAATLPRKLHRYLLAHEEVSDLLITGGDPLVMRTQLLAAIVEPLLTPRFSHVQNIRIGTKTLSYWPHRFVSDRDADDLLQLLEKMVQSGKHVALMAHVNHWRELDTPIAREAIGRLRNTGTVIRTQAPLLAHINDNPKIWERMWRQQVRLGMVPYYMFIERHTGPVHYFEVPLARGWKIYRQAINRLSGLSRTARGPSMSAAPGKVEIQGVAKICGRKVFVLRFIQSRCPEWVQRPFFARYDPQATWLDQLRPAFNSREFFYEAEYRRIVAREKVLR